MSEVIEVDAELIEAPQALEVVYTPATITDNLAALSDYVDKQLAYYKGVTIDPGNAQHIKDARSVMASLNKLKEPIEKERKRIKKEYEAPLKAFESEVKAITSKIDDVRGAIKAKVDEADKQFKAQRYAHLEEEYTGVAGILAELIGFDAILDPKWLNRSKAESAAEAELQDKAATALRGYETLLKKTLNHSDEVMKRYAETLDLTAALELEDELNERDRQMEEFKAKQAEVMGEPAAEPVPEPMQAEPVHPEPEKQPEKAIEPVFRWSLVMQFEGTREKAHSVADALKRLGVSGATIKAIREVRS